MKNFWLWHVLVKEFPGQGWYVVKYSEARKHIHDKSENRLSFETPYQFYLHNDGKWRSTTCSGQSWSGYYKNKEDAESALTQYGHKGI